MEILDLVEKIESKIFELDAKHAFPVNIGINEIEVHYTPSTNDETIIKENDLVKADIDLHENEYIGDFAFSVAFNKEDEELIKVAKNAVKEVRKELREGIKIKQISEIIKNYVKRSGLNIVRNLTSDFLDTYMVHGISIPNVKNENETELKKDKLLL